MGRSASDEDSIGALLSNWLDQEWEARFLLDERLRVLWHNQVAGNWLERPHCPLKLEGEALAARDAGLHCRFQSLFSGESAAVRTLSLSDSVSDKEILFCARQVGGPGISPHFGLSVRSTCSSQAHELVGLQEAFHLTPSEEAVLKKMVRGDTVDRIARASKISPETVRTHVRRAYSKMSVSSREEMFSRITPFLFGREKL